MDYVLLVPMGIGWTRAKRNAFATMDSTPMGAIAHHAQPICLAVRNVQDPTLAAVVRQAHIIGTILFLPAKHAHRLAQVVALSAPITTPVLIVPRDGSGELQTTLATSAMTHCQGADPVKPIKYVSLATQQGTSGTQLASVSVTPDTF